MDRRNVGGFEWIDEGDGVAPRTAISSVGSRTHKLNSEENKMCGFFDLRLAFRYPVEQRDQMMMEYCNGELLKHLTTPSWRSSSDGRQRVRLDD